MAHSYSALEIREMVADTNKAVDGLRKKIITRAGKNMAKACQLVERDAKLLFKPSNAESVSGEPPRVKTGLARASISHRVDENESGPVGHIGTNVEYALGLEFGTPDTWPHPFLTPAITSNADAIRKIVADDAIKEAIAEACE